MSPGVERVKPPFQQIASHLRDQILRGEIGPGETVPSVRELAAAWGVAHATADKALRALRQDGLVEARRGAGTVVRGEPPVYRGVRDRLATVRRTGRIYTRGEYAKIVAAREAPAPEDVAAAFHVDLGTPVILRHRVTYLGDRPLTSSTTWFPADVAGAAPLLLTAERIVEGTGRYVEIATGRRISHGEEQVCARLASPDEAAELGRPEPLAVLETKHTAWDERGMPFTYEIGLAPAGYHTRYSYDVHLTDEEGSR